MTASRCCKSQAGSPDHPPVLTCMHDEVIVWGTEGKTHDKRQIEEFIKKN